MEKPEQEKGANRPELQKPLVWDCGSTLYDSFELQSFKRQLESVVVTRSCSMPHLPAASPHKASKQFSLRKFLRSFFKTKPDLNTPPVSGFPEFQPNRASADGRLYVLYGGQSRLLSKIDEAPDMVRGREYSFSPEICSITRRTASERFTAPSVNFVP